MCRGVSKSLACIAPDYTNRGGYYSSILSLINTLRFSKARPSTLQRTSVVLIYKWLCVDFNFLFNQTLRNYAENDTEFQFIVLNWTKISSWSGFIAELALGKKSCKILKISVQTQSVLHKDCKRMQSLLLFLMCLCFGRVLMIPEWHSFFKLFSLQGSGKNKFVNPLKIGCICALLKYLLSFLIIR